MKNLALTIIIPAFNESALLTRTLSNLQAIRERGVRVIVVDGGSADDSAACASPLADLVVTANKGRATQQNAGAAIATSEVLLFLHADTMLPPDVDTLITNALSVGNHVWGRFDIAFDVNTPMLRVVAWMMNARSRLTGIATGDQAIFVWRDAFNTVGQFAAICLMEDIVLSKKLKALSPPACLRARVTTSSRRWREQGVWQTIVLMWWLRFAYMIGVSPLRLAQWYQSPKIEEGAIEN
jgi:rSAM/selenodomain-associated transferase 2